MNDVEKTINNIRSFDIINYDDSFEYAKKASELLRNNAECQNGRRIIINILDNWNKVDLATKDIWVDLIEAAGFYPYLHLNKFELSDTASKIRKEYHKSDLLENIYLHEEQFVIKKILESDKNVIVSAPTSFGKSLLIDELVCSGKYKNMVIIQPTLALLDETRRRLSKYRNNKLLVRTSQKPDKKKNNIFLFTAERVMEYAVFPKIDLLVLDEFYKLSAKRDDERSDVLNNAFYKLLTNYRCKFYLLGPNIDKISPGFEDEYNAEFKQTKYNLVDSITIDIYKTHGHKFGTRGIKKEYKENFLFELLTNELKNEQTLIYCSSPSRARYLSKKLCEYMMQNNLSENAEELLLIDWIKNNVVPEWSLLNCLYYGIGIHDGALPKHITTSIINYFNNNKLNFLFCTTTIIEGVNTSAKNVIFFDSSKGYRIPIDYFDYSNIQGRAGRLMVHYIGNIYNFNKSIPKEEIIVDIPFYQQKPIADEVLIQLKEQHVKDKESKQYEKISKLNDEEKKLFKKNGLLVWGQKKIVDYLDNNINTIYKNINWHGYPEYEQLHFIIGLCWDNLMKKSESKGRMTKNNLTYNINKYTIEKSIKSLIVSRYDFFKSKETNKTSQEIWDESILWAFKFQRHWLHYKIPKWIGVFNELQKFVCEKHNKKPGEYTFYANLIENEFVQENMALLLEYGIPLSAIQKIEKKISNDMPEEEAIDRVRKMEDFELEELLPYEREKLKTSL